jgi:hypothetical protein
LEFDLPAAAEGSMSPEPGQQSNQGSKTATIGSTE